MRYKRYILLFLLGYFPVLTHAWTRDDIINMVEKYCDIKWTCYNSYYCDAAEKYIYKSSNSYVGMAYWYGGFDSIDEFKNKVETLQKQPCTEAGIDCSGFVSRCWNFSWKEGTYNLEYASTIQGRRIYTLNNFSELRKGDILVDYYPWRHVVIFYYYSSSNNEYWIYDAAKYSSETNEYEYKVARRIYSYDVVSTCTPRSLFNPGVEEQNQCKYTQYDCKVSPNPFWNIAQIKYSIPQENHVNLIVYDISGRKIKTLVSGEKTSGSYTVRWNGRDEDGTLVKNGVYFIKLKTKHFSKTNKLIFLKQ